MEGTTRGATADPSKGSTGRDPDCNMANPTRGANEERAHTAATGPPAARTPPAGGEAELGSREALAGVGAEENYLADTTPGGGREEVMGRLHRCHQSWTAGQEARGEELSGLQQEKYTQGPRTVEAPQGATEEPKSACVPVHLARRQSGVAGTTGTDGKAGPRRDGAVSGPGPRPATHDVSEEGRVRVCGGSLCRSTSSGLTATSS